MIRQGGHIDAQDERAVGRDKGERIFAAGAFVASPVFNRVPCHIGGAGREQHDNERAKQNDSLGAVGSRRGLWKRRLIKVGGVFQKVHFRRCGKNGPTLGTTNVLVGRDPLRRFQIGLAFGTCKGDGNHG